LNPDQFVLITNSDKDSGESDIAEMKSNFRDSDLTLKLLKSGKLSKMDMNDPDVKEWVESTIRIAAPWLFFFLLIFFGCFCYLCYCCDCCPCCCF